MDCQLRQDRTIPHLHQCLSSPHGLTQESLDLPSCLFPANKPIFISNSIPQNDQPLEDCPIFFRGWLTFFSDSKYQSCDNLQDMSTLNSLSKHSVCRLRAQGCEQARTDAVSPGPGPDIVTGRCESDLLLIKNLTPHTFFTFLITQNRVMVIAITALANP